MARAKKLPSGMWRCRISIGKDASGKYRTKSFTAPTKREAEFLAAQYAQTHTTDPSDMTVARALNSYVDSREGVLSPGTVREYRRMIRAGYYEPLSGYHVSKLTSEQVQRLISDLSLKHNAKTVANIINLFLSSCNAVNPERRFVLSMPKRVKPDPTVPCDDEVKLLLQEAAPELRLCIALAAIGGLRRGEICALKYEDVSVDLNTVYIHADIVLNDDNVWVYKPIPKTAASVRSVVLPPEVIRMIGKTRESSGFILDLNPGKITDRFGRLKAKLQIDIRFHDLRHYTASIMHALGVPDQYIMERGGWGSDSVMKSVYRNTLSDKSRKFTAITNDYFRDSFDAQLRPSESTG